jgi:non-homologous end joining protein Ku
MEIVMAARAYWKGSLKLSLVSCPVLLYPASTTSDKTRLHMINKETGNRLKQQMIDAETGDVVESDQKARGYELKNGEYVEVEKEELEAVQIESNHTIDIDGFVPKDEIDKRYLNHPYYIAPDGKAGIDAFAVIRDKAAEPEEKPDNVISLMDALKQSLKGRAAAKRHAPARRTSYRAAKKAHHSAARARKAG